MLRALLLIIIIVNSLALPAGAQFTNDNLKNTFEGYIQIIQKKIEGSNRYFNLDRNYRVKIGFRLDQLGNINDIKTIETSGNNDFDYNMTETIIDAAPFEPLPYNFTGKELNFTAEIIARRIYITCPYATTDPRILDRQRTLEQQMQQIEARNRETQQQRQIQEQNTKNQVRQGVNSIFNQIRSIPRW